MNRREFVPIASAATWASTVACQSPKAPSRLAEWCPRIAANVQSLDQATLRWAAQMGLEWITLGETESIDAEGKGYWSKWDVREVRDRCDAFGLRLHSLELPARWLDGPRLGNDGRGPAIENVCESLLAAGDAGVAVVEWPWSAEVRWGSDTSWSKVFGRLAEFADQMMPAAEQAGVKMSLSPKFSLPLGHLGHRPVFTSIKHVEQFFETVPSPANGITMSHRTIPGISIVGAIRRIGHLGRIHHVEFDSEAAIPAMGSEQRYPNGLAVMRAYKESGYVLGMVSDHASALPKGLRGSRVGCSYSHGFMRGLVEAVSG